MCCHVLQDYENTTEYHGRHKQADCGVLAGNRPETDSICKINKDELLRVRVHIYEICN